MTVISLIATSLKQNSQEFYTVFSLMATVSFEKVLLLHQPNIKPTEKKPAQQLNKLPPVINYDTKPSLSTLFASAISNRMMDQQLRYHRLKQLIILL